MAQTNSKGYLFESMPVPKAVMELSIPMVVTSLVMVVYNLADTFAYGAAAVAAVGVSHKINMLPLQVCLGFSQGIASGQL